MKIIFLVPKSFGYVHKYGTPNLHLNKCTFIYGGGIRDREFMFRHNMYLDICVYVLLYIFLQICMSAYPCSTLKVSH